jgi:hypothetical protein
MEKSKLLSFINKYTVGGIIQSTEWKLSDVLVTDFISDDKSLIGNVTLKNVNVNNNLLSIGIYNTKSLNKMITILSNDIEIEPILLNDRPIVLKISDKNTNIEYVLADLSVIPKVPSLKKLPNTHLQFIIDKEFSDSFIKAKDAIADVDTFSIIRNDKTQKFEVIVGNLGKNFDKIILNITPSIVNDLEFKSITFSSKHFKEILSSNKDCSNGILDVSFEGLATVSFSNDDFDSKYHLIELTNI